MSRPEGDLCAASHRIAFSTNWTRRPTAHQSAAARFPPPIGFPAKPAALAAMKVPSSSIDIQYVQMSTAVCMTTHNRYCNTGVSAARQVRGPRGTGQQDTPPQPAAAPRGRDRQRVGHGVPGRLQHRWQRLTRPRRIRAGGGAAAGACRGGGRAVEKAAPAAIEEHAYGRRGREDGSR